MNSGCIQHLCHKLSLYNYYCRLGNCMQSWTKKITTKRRRQGGVLLAHAGDWHTKAHHRGNRHNNHRYGVHYKQSRHAITNMPSPSIDTGVLHINDRQTTRTNSKHNTNTAWSLYSPKGVMHHHTQLTIRGIH